MRTTNNRIHIPSALSALIATVAIMVVSVFPSALAYADGGSAPTVPVQVSKVDADGTALKGAQLRISHKDANGADVIDAEWTSDGTVHTADLPAGDYTLTETTAPEGYDKAADQTFTVKAPENPAPTDYSFTTQSSLTSGALVSKDASKTVSPCTASTCGSPARRADWTTRGSKAQPPRSASSPSAHAPAPICIRTCCACCTTAIRTTKQVSNRSTI